MRVLRILYRVFWDYWFNWSWKRHKPWDMTWEYWSGRKIEPQKEPNNPTNYVGLEYARRIFLFEKDISYKVFFSFGIMFEESIIFNKNDFVIHLQIWRWVVLLGWFLDNTRSFNKEMDKQMPNFKKEKEPKNEICTGNRKH